MITVIYHRADFDGLFSAAVCKKFLPIDTTFIGWDFGDPLIEYPGGKVYIVDLPVECLKTFPDDAWNITWIDHHKSSIDKWEAQPGYQFNGYRIDGVAACRLCWQWFQKEKRDVEDLWCGNLPTTRLPTLEEFQNRTVSEPLALTLAGEYDVWDLRDDRALPFQFGLTAGRYSLQDGLLSLLDLPKNLDLTGEWVFPGDVEAKHIIQCGQASMNWQQVFAEQVCRERAYVKNWEGHTFCVLASCHARNSTWFPECAISPQCDALMCWRYDGEKVMFSLYHAPGHTDIDLSPIAVKYGGGGHRGACGFSTTLRDALPIIEPEVKK